MTDHSLAKPHLNACLDLVFQPIVGLFDGEVVGFEALARLHGRYAQHTLGERPIGPADESFLQHLTLLMLRRGCAQFEQWRKTVPGAERWSLSLNLPSLEVNLDSILSELASLQSIYDLPAGALRLELSEHARVANFVQARDAIEAISRAGVSVLIDDFGAGATSLRWLAELPVSGLKLDRWLAHAAKSNLKARSIISALTGMSEQMDILVIAEGIEHLDTVRILQDCGCALGQGYWFSAPLSAAAVLQWTLDRQARPQSPPSCMGDKPS